MKNTTQVYLEQDGKYLMLLRNKKENDMNEGKWIAVGGKFEEGETPKECAVREVLEETGYLCGGLEYRGKVSFLNDVFDSEMMHIFTCSDFKMDREPVDDEGTLEWIDKERILDLNLWEGDRVFLKYLLEDGDFFDLTLEYSGYDLKNSYLNDGMDIDG